MRLIRHTGIYVDNLDKMKDFYCRYFGMEVVVHDVEGGKYSELILGIPSIRIELYKLKRSDGTMIELLKPIYSQVQKQDAHSDSVVNSGCVHIAFTVESLDEMYNNMISEGIYFISQPVVSPNGDVYVCFCRDPEGNYLELVQELKV